jgi:hypothetical protein
MFIVINRNDGRPADGSDTVITSLVGQAGSAIAS